MKALSWLVHAANRTNAEFGSSSEALLNFFQSFVKSRRRLFKQTSTVLPS